MLNSKSEGMAHLVPFKEFLDPRGKLVVGQFPKELPFEVKRFFIVSGVPSGDVRGIHAHKHCHQLLVCVAGSLRALVDDGFEQNIYDLDSSSQGLYMPPLTWGSQFDYSPDAVLLVLASDFFDQDDYIHDYSEFQTLKK